MVVFSAKRKYFLAKCCVLLMFVLTALALAKRWPGARRTAWAYFADPVAEEFERQVLEDEARVEPGLGEGGAPAVLAEDEQWRAAESKEMYGASWYVSDRISYTRTLKDNRHAACAGVEYDAELPSASVIIPFHDEPYSALLRTVWNILSTARRDQPWHQKANFVDRATGRITTLGYKGQEPDSEHVYLKEILLVDDHSTLLELRGKLAHYLRTRLPRGLVRLLRLPEWRGLMRARQAGARAARGDVLIVLDAHCEGVADWIRPLLQRIKDKRTAVVCPNIDVISNSNFAYISDKEVMVGGFQFLGDYSWIPLPAREWLRRGSEIAPTRSPTMFAAVFAASRAYFWQLGGYDEGMAGWGGEDLEMSFRVWQCGGSLEVLPCSRVGHMFRQGHPFATKNDSFGVNTARMALVWMDEYAELYFLDRPDLRNAMGMIGSLADRKALRTRLRCKSFEWFLDTVYPEKFVPVRDPVVYGRVRNAVTELCLDSMNRDQKLLGLPLGLYPCSRVLTTTQHYSLSPAGQLRDELKCVELERILEDEVAPRLLLVQCDERERGQQWEYLRASQQLRHVASGLCADAAGAGAWESPRALRCQHPARPSQQWTFDYDDTSSSSAGEVLPAEVERRLQQLRRRRARARPAPAGAAGAAGAAAGRDTQPT